MLRLSTAFGFVKHNDSVYKHNTMADLETQLQAAQGARSRIIVTDGSFSMDGTIAQLDKICDLADRYDAIVMIDELHSSGSLARRARYA